MGTGSPNGSLKIISLAWPAESAKVPTPFKFPLSQTPPRGHPPYAEDGTHASFVHNDLLYRWQERGPPALGITKAVLAGSAG